MNTTLRFCAGFYLSGGAQFIHQIGNAFKTQSVWVS
jgi:hypothetical protein